MGATTPPCGALLYDNEGSAVARCQQPWGVEHDHSAGTVQEMVDDRRAVRIVAPPWDVLTTQQREMIDHYKEYNVEVQWFVGERGKDGAVEVIALGENFAWSFLVSADGTFFSSSEASVGGFDMGIEI